ncbi:MAG TPA: glycosyltransferase family 39 protein, partial [Bacteroidia bacterium]|nr:glycosyltransferase family 39 protein [Bacteroidia bacterium]
MSQIKYTSAKYENRIIFVLLGLFISIVAIARYHLLSIPLERDEGEYAYMAKLILDGHPPYTLACNMKLPGTYYMYALIMKIFGGTDIGIHTGLAIINIASVILLFRIVDKLIGKNAAIISAITFGVVSTSWTVLGQAAHATQFVNLFSLLGINTILKKNSEFELKRWHYILSGIYFSLAFICKQSGIFFLLLGISIAIINSNSKYSLKSIASKVIC